MFLIGIQCKNMDCHVLLAQLFEEDVHPYLPHNSGGANSYRLVGSRIGKPCPGLVYSPTFTIYLPLKTSIFVGKYTIVPWMVYWLLNGGDVFQFFLGEFGIPNLKYDSMHQKLDIFFQDELSR